MWSQAFDTCVVCGETDSPHMAKGKCRRCYLAEYRNDPANKKRIDKAKMRWHKKVGIHRLAEARNKRNFGGLRDKVLKRDRNRCRECGSDKLLTVHHLDGQGRGSKDPNNEMNNLVTLCRACHARAHARCGNRWAIGYDVCQDCLSNEHPHNAKGLCRKCYQRVRHKRVR